MPGTGCVIAFKTVSWLPVFETFEPFLYDYTIILSSGIARNSVRDGGSTNSVEDRGQGERGSGGGSPLVRFPGGSCDLVQGILFHIVKFS